jgi:hypothetical protein
MTLADLQQTLAAAVPPGKSAGEQRLLIDEATGHWPELAPTRSAEAWGATAIRAVQGETARQTTLLRSGLLLMHDFLDESHVQSQSMEGDPDADLWHAIMHRREPDYGNAKYWCRQVGAHSVFRELAQQAAPILSAAGATGFSSDEWDAIRFVDLCQRVERESSPLNRAARQVQWIEMSLHLSHCLRGR